MIRGELRYMNKRGAGCIDYGNAAMLARRLKTLRCEADLYVDGALVGGCTAIDHADDGRIKWNWWYDPDAVGEVTA